LLILCVTTITAFTQSEKIDYTNPKKYNLAGVTVSGTKFLDNNTLISISGLSIGQEIMVPGDKISKAINNLWKQGLFTDASIQISKIEASSA
jgi:outer membrane protein insertion porin family